MSTCLSTTKMSLDRRFLILSIPELNYLLLNLTALENQLASYRMADSSNKRRMPLEPAGLSHRSRPRFYSSK